MNEKEDIRPVVVTHSGKHHADETLAVFFLRARYGDIRLVRTCDTRLMERADILLDCGGVYDPAAGRFDHHGVRRLPAPQDYRPAGYATAGLVWRQYGREICQMQLAAFTGGSWGQCRAAQTHPSELMAVAQRLADRLDRELVAPIDSWDNGFYPSKQVSSSWLPLQWLIPHMDFEQAVEILGKSFIHRMRVLADGQGDRWMLAKSLTENGPADFYCLDQGVLVVAPPDTRVEVSAAQRVVREGLELPLVGVLSAIRNGTKWAALLSEPLPRQHWIPEGIEFTSSRRQLFHTDQDTLLDFLRDCYTQEG